MTAASQIKLIHVACRDLGLDEDTRRDLQLVVTGKDSLKAMSEPELEAVVAALKAKGATNVTVLGVGTRPDFARDAGQPGG